MLLIVVVSCKKDDPAASNALIGNWKFVSAVKTGCTDPNNNYSETCTTNCGTLAITASGWTFTQTGSPTESGTYTINGNQVTLTKPGGSTDDYTYAIVGSSLTFTNTSGGTGCVEVTTFSKI